MPDLDRWLVVLGPAGLGLGAWKVGRGGDGGLGLLATAGVESLGLGAWKVWRGGGGGLGLLAPAGVESIPCRLLGRQTEEVVVLAE